MVVFTCNNCGEAVQKPKVDKHLHVICRKKTGFISLTCVDCLKDFAENYEQHTKCVTEDERYAAKGYQAKESSNKGERKQEQWSDNIKSILNREQNLSDPQRRLLQTLTHHANVPRKKPKFMNFIKNIRSSCSNFDANKVFDLLEAEFKANTATNTANKSLNGNKSSASESIKVESNEPSADTNSSKSNGMDCEDGFKWKKTILKIVKDKKQIKRTKLLKKFINAYKQTHKKVPENIKVLFDEKLVKMKKIEIDTKMVQLKSNSEA